MSKRFENIVVPTRSANFPVLALADAVANDGRALWNAAMSMLYTDRGLDIPEHAVSAAAVCVDWCDANGVKTEQGTCIGWRFIP